MSEVYGNEWLIWLGILLCISQSAMFSGLNLALFGISRLRLEVEATSGSKAAKRILLLRQDANFLLTTILWGNVGMNVLLALLSNSVLAGVGAFLFSTVFITFFGEITPQAYFSRNALLTGSLLAPVLRIYQILLYPVAKPTALLLDWTLGREGVQYFREKDIRTLIQKHVEADESDIDRLEGVGAMNFLALDDLLVTQEGEQIDPLSVIVVPHYDGFPVFPDYQCTIDDPFVQAVNASGKKWVIFTDSEDEPSLVMNANEFLRAMLFSDSPVSPRHFCHHPVIVRDTRMLLGSVLSKMMTAGAVVGEDVIEHDLVLVWAEQRRVITGTDILGRLLHGVTPLTAKLAFA
ncbi:MAG: CNNM domain-containing protein [Gammaproteobacteria bacterium]|nr:CNNM domain-containing protein [Gammaproteobacteria bacterium]